TPAATVEVIEDFSAGYHSRNGGGDTIATDGDLPVLDLRGLHTVNAPSAAPPTDSRDQRPAATIVGALLVAVGAVISLITGIVQVIVAGREATELGLDAEDVQIAAALLVGVGAFTIAIAVAQLLLALAVYRGSNRARVFVMILGALLVLSL